MTAFSPVQRPIPNVLKNINIEQEIAFELRPRETHSRDPCNCDYTIGFIITLGLLFEAGVPLIVEDGAPASARDGSLE